MDCLKLDITQFVEHPQGSTFEEPVTVYSNKNHELLFTTSDEVCDECFFVIEQKEGDEVYSGNLTECLEFIRSAYHA